jgi:hypothetical protein
MSGFEMRQTFFGALGGLCLLLTSPSSAQVRRGSLVVSIVSQRADYVVIGSESRAVTSDNRFVDDRSCKVISLGGDTIFFETGTEKIIVRLGKSWNTEGIARAVYSSSVNRDASNLSAVFAQRALRWFQTQSDVDLRSGANGPQGNLIGSGFINFGSNGTLSVHLISIDYDSATHALTAQHTSPHPGQVNISGVATDLVTEFFVGKTERAVESFGPIGMMRVVGGNATEDIRLVRKAIEFAEANATDQDKSSLGGEIDIAVIRNNGTIQWVSRKAWCSEQDLKPSSELKHK